MTMQFWRNLGYLLCLVGLWFRIASVDLYDEFKFILAFLAFWGGVVLLALLLFLNGLTSRTKKRNNNAKTPHFAAFSL